MDQNRSRNEDVPNRSSNMEPAEGSRDTVRNSNSSATERGTGSAAERNRKDSDASDRMDSDSSGQRATGITNRALDRERCEQEQLPERGHSQSER